MDCSISATPLRNLKSPFVKQWKDDVGAVNFLRNRQEKLLRQVATVAKFSDDNKPKKSLKKWTRTASDFINLIQSGEISSGWIQKDRI